jgi:4-amino-4-deoxy-L-arabinose transferase-like glycosyltransferase
VEIERNDKSVCSYLIFSGAAALVATLPLSSLDNAAFKFFQNLDLADWNSLAKLFTQVGDGVLLGAISLLAFAAMRNRRTATRIVFSLLLSTIIVTILKELVSRQRPGSDTANSFPSGHTASAFAVAGALFIHLRGQGVVFLPISALIGFSRVLRNSHYVSDVTAGLGIGLICAGAAGLIVMRAPRFAHLRTIRLIGGFLALCLTIFPWAVRRETLQQAILIVMPPIALFAVWSYMSLLTRFARNVIEKMSDKRLLVAIFAVCLLLFIVGNWASTLFDRDEGWYAETAREMLASGNYLTPTYNAQPYLEKPPLTYWLMAGSISIFGPNAFAARFPSAVAGALACVVLFLLARSMFDRKTALASVAVFATSLITLIIVHAALMDSILLLLVLISLYAFWRIYRGDTSYLLWLMFYGGAGLAFLTKYLAGVAIIGVAAFATLAFTRRWDLLRKARILTGALVFLAIVGAWFLPAYLATSGDLLRVFLNENFGRSVSPMEGHSGPFFYYVLVLPVIFFPWFSFLPGAVLRRRPEIAPGSERWWFLVSWAGGTIILFSAVSTKLPHYVLPAIPALAILIGSLISDSEDRSRALTRWRVPFAYVFLTLLGFVLAAGIPVALKWWKFYGLWRFFTPACALLLTMTILAVFDLRRRDLLRTASTLTCGSTGFTLLLILVAIPSLNTVKLPQPIGRIIAEKSTPRDAILHWGYIPPTLVFYAQHPLTLIRTQQELDAQISGASRAFCVLPAEEAERLRQRSGAGLRIETLFPAPGESGRGFDFGRGKWQQLELLQAEPHQPP